MADNKISNFQDRYLHGAWETIKFWLFLKRIYWGKRMAVFEAMLDKFYFETKYPEALSYDDTEDRKKLEEHHRLPYEKQDPVILANFEEKITRSKAIKESYRRNENFLLDSEKYVEMLELWFSEVNKEEENVSETPDQI